MRLIVMKRNSLGLLVLLVLLVAGCGPEQQDPPYGAGKDGVPDIVNDVSDYDTFWMSRIEVAEINQLSGQDPGHNTLVSAYFTDFVHYRVVVAGSMPFSEACYVYTSMPSDVKFCKYADTCQQDSDCPVGWTCIENGCAPIPAECQEDSQCPGILVCDQGLCTWPECPEGSCVDNYSCAAGSKLPLYVEHVVFGGLVEDDLQLDPASPGRFQRVLEGRAFKEEQVWLQVVSTDTVRSFPAFEEQIQAPVAPVITRLDTWKNPDLTAYPSIGIQLGRVESLIVEWQAQGADYMEIKIVPGSGSQTPYAKLRCITFDDGGLEVPAEALRYLALDQATNFQFKLERHHFVGHAIREEEDDSVKAMALLDTSSTVAGTVVR